MVFPSKNTNQGLILCFLQIQFGLISLGQGFVIDAYPMVVSGFDFVIIFVTVSLVTVFTTSGPTKDTRHQTESNE